MLDFPNSAIETKELAEKLVKFLRDKIENTQKRPAWSGQNFRLLQEFFRPHGVACFPGVDGPQFLWDFVGYIKERGILIAAESEHDDKPASLKYDFEKLLYLRSPLKLFMCRIRNEQDAESIRSYLEEFMQLTCTEYSAGEVFIIYCVWWAEPSEKNRDIAYILQVDGKPNYVGIKGKSFQLIPR